MSNLYTMDGEPRFPICPACGEVLLTDGVKVGLDVYCAWCAQIHTENKALDDARDDAILATYRRTMPSRDFLVRQSVLNALLEMFPASTGLKGGAAVMRWYLAERGGVTGTPFHLCILDNFNKLVAAYA